MMLPETAELYLNDSRGIFIPQRFAMETKRECVAGITDEDWETILAGPGGEWYWESWDSIQQNAILTDPTNGQQFSLYQDGDLWLIPIDAEWPDDID